MRDAVAVLALLLASAFAQNTPSSTASSTLSITSSSSTSTRRTVYSVPNYTLTASNASLVTNPSADVPTGSYQTGASQASGITVLPSSTSNSTFSRSSFFANSSTTTNTLLIIGGTPTPSNVTVSVTSTSSLATPTNTQPCNGYPEFCSRKYSNITGVAAHNAAFFRANNAFSNQAVPVLGQLNDGIRMIQGEVHYANDTLLNCHSSCDFINTGTYESLLVTIREWVQAHPYDVVTLLIVNSQYANVTAFEAPFAASGMLPYVYLPPRVPMRLEDWPTLEQMILSGKRVVVFMDYQADQNLVPYIQDEFTNMWETPFSPTDIEFPCDVQRPPSLKDVDARDNLLYLANHNLNVEFSLGGSDVLIPNLANIELVNAANSSTGSLLTMANTCTSDWGRPPNWLLVDFYDVGGGSVFEVAAQMNNVTYTGQCCGLSVGVDANDGEALAPGGVGSLAALVLAIALLVFWS